MGPFPNSRAVINFSWQDTYSSRISQKTEFLLKHAKVGGTIGQVHQPFNEIPSIFPETFEDSSSFCTSKGNKSRSFHLSLDNSAS